MFLKTSIYVCFSGFSGGLVTSKKYAKYIKLIKNNNISKFIKKLPFRVLLKPLKPLNF